MPTPRPRGPLALALSALSFLFAPPTLTGADRPASHPAEAAVTRGGADDPAVARQLAESVRRYDKLLEQDPSLAEAWQRRGLAHFRLGHVEQAVADFDKYL